MSRPTSNTRIRVRNLAAALALAFGCIAAADAQVSFGVAVPGASFGFNVPAYPPLVPVPGYPVYYAPNVNANYFFYDGMYWLYANDNWYESSWYNGPWYVVPPDAVPLYVLRVPVRYYRRPPPYFHAWRADAAPRWDQHWGRGWADNHRDWDRWDRRGMPARAPLPSYQRQFAGDRYPHAEDRQRAYEARNYRYQPRDEVVRQHYEARNGARADVPRGGQQHERGAAGRAEGFGGGEQHRGGGEGQREHGERGAH